MNRQLVPAMCILLASVALLGCQGAPAGTTQTATSTPETIERKPPTDLEALAQRLVNESAGVKEGDIVQISGGVQDLELLENIAVHVRELGAFPFVIVNSDRMTKRLFTDVPAKYDTQLSEAGMKLAGIVTVSIVVDSNLNEGLLADADPVRRAARGKANQPIGNELLRRNVRQVEVGNNLYPTPWRASRLGMTESELTKAFWEGVNVDYAGLQTKGEQVRSVLAAGNELHITNPNGTDLRVSIQGKPLLVSDGVISPEDVRKGGAAVSAYLPAGEVYCAPVSGTAEGKFVQSRAVFDGKEIQDLTMTFARGKLVSMTGSGAGFSGFKALYDAAGEGKDIFSFVDLGINPQIKLPSDTKLGTWVPSGMITVGIGDNAWAGGDNKIAYGYAAFLPGSTVTLDGKTIIAKGQLQI
jgi:aminopeptidase